MAHSIVELIAIHTSEAVIFCGTEITLGGRTVEAGNAIAVLSRSALDIPCNEGDIGYRTIIPVRFVFQNVS